MLPNHCKKTPHLRFQKSCDITKLQPLPESSRIRIQELMSGRCVPRCLKTVVRGGKRRWVNSPTGPLFSPCLQRSTLYSPSAEWLEMRPQLRTYFFGRPQRSPLPHLSVVSYPGIKCSLKDHMCHYSIQACESPGWVVVV